MFNGEDIENSDSHYVLINFCWFYEAKFFFPEIEEGNFRKVWIIMILKKGNSNRVSLYV